MDVIENPYRGQGLDGMDDVPSPSVNVAAPQGLLTECPAAKETPLQRYPGAGPELWIKDERGRMGLGSFKALGAAYVIAHSAKVLGEAQEGRVWVTASAGNHGMSVAAGARAFGARAVVYLAHTVPEGFAGRLRDQGAEVIRAGDDYAASMQAAAQAAQNHGWTLLSDSSWAGYMDLPHRLMEGYLVMAEEAARQMPKPPTHIFLQAGVGGLAGAAAAYFRHVWGDAPRIMVVEPDAAPALQASIQAGRAVETQGPVSSMGRLDCKEPSLIALKGLARDADGFATLSDAEVEAILPRLVAADLASSPSGAAGVAAAWLSDVPDDARVLCILSEGEAA